MYYLRWIFLNIKRLLMTPETYLEMGIIVITLVLCTNINIPDSSTMSIGLMYGGGETARQMYEELLVDGTYDYVEYVDRQVLARDVTSGVVDCGFVFDERIDTAIEGDDIAECIEYIQSTTTSKGSVLREKVYAILYRHISEHLLVANVASGEMFSGDRQQIEQTLLGRNEYYANSDEVFTIVFSSRESGQTQGAYIKTDEKDICQSIEIYLIAIVIFAASLFGMSACFDSRARRVLGRLSRHERHIYIYMSSLAHGILVYATLFLYFCHSGAVGVGVWMLLLIYTLATTLVAQLLSYIIRNRNIYLYMSLCLVILVCVGGMSRV